jgi:hypothetical protein
MDATLHMPGNTESDPDAFSQHDVEKKGNVKTSVENDVFGDEENAEVKYKTMAWWYVSQHQTSPQPCPLEGYRS